MTKIIRVIGLSTASIALASAAQAADPTYTSQIGDALEAVNMTSMTADISAFAAMGFGILLVSTGVFFVAKILRRFLS